MKKSIIFKLIGLVVLLPVAVFASNKTGQFCLYSKKNVQSTCQKVSVNTPFVTIIRHDDWAKLGLRDKDGSVGWVHIPQYRAAQKALNQSDIQTVYVSVNKKKDGKPVYNIVAYKNGQPVSKEAAQKLYQKLRRNQQIEQKHFNRLNSMMEKMMDRDFMNTRQLMRSAFPDFTPGDELPAVKSKAELKG